MKFVVVSVLLGSLAAQTLTNFFESVAEELIPNFHSPKKEVIPDHYMIKFKKTSANSNIENHFTALNSIISQANAFAGKKSENELKHVYHGVFDGYSGKFQPEVINMIRKTEEVEYVEKDSVVNAINTEIGAPWGLARISHKKALDFSSYNKYLYDDRAGANVTVYVIDTGINYEHVDFEGRASWGKTIPQGDRDEDGNGHGTHCAGTIGGKKYGVAKHAKIVAVKVLRSNGSGSMSDVVKGVEWAANAASEEARSARSNGKTHKGSVANMSLGGGYSRFLNEAVNGAVKKGLHFAVAAGNDDEDACEYSPASAELAVTVGATTINDERAWFSNWGKCTDIFAPGLNVLSTWKGSKHATNTISGTSMASPHVAGVLAYYLSLEDKPITPEELKNKVISNAIEDVLGDIDSKSPNKLVYINPPKN